MFFKKPKQKDEVLPGSVIITQYKENPTLEDKVNLQQQVISELFEMVKLMANHKRFEYIQKKMDIVQNLLDKLMEKK